MSNTYEHRAVLFLDVLGFKQLINDKKEYLIEKALSITSAQYQSNYETSAFSDNMVVSVKFERGYELLELIHFANFLNWNLLHYGILSRGGIAVGELHHRDGIIYGPALIRAYQLESQIAIYPRIVLDKHAISSSPHLADCEELIKNQLRIDFDGWEHIHFMSHQALMPFHEMLPPTQGQIDIQELTKAKIKAVNNTLENNPPTDMRSQSKHDWIRNYVEQYAKIYLT